MIPTQIISSPWPVALNTKRDCGEPAALTDSSTTDRNCSKLMEMAHSKDPTEEQSVINKTDVESWLRTPTTPPSVGLSLTTTVNLTLRTQPKSNLEISSISSGVGIIPVAFDEKQVILRW